MTTTWAAITASVRGATHVRKGLPNQDAVATRAVGSTTIAAVADGHGGDRYVRSATGAQLAVELACDLVGDALADGRSLDEVVATTPAELVPRWRAEVLADVAASPFTDEERTRAGVPLEDDATIAYGATLLLVIAADEVAILQLGDGDVLVGLADGSVLDPVPTDDRLVASQTTSLCLPDAVGDFRSAMVRAGARPDLVLASTDGYGNSFADPGWREKVVGDLRRQIARDGAESVQSQLAGWLGDSAAAAGDDTSAAILTRAAAAIDATVLPGSAAAKPAARAERPAARSAGAGPPRVVAIVAALVAVVAAIGFWALQGGGGAPATTTSLPAGSTPTEQSTTVLQVSRVEEIGAVGAEGVVVTFTPDPARPDPRRVARAITPDAVTRADVGATRWEIAGRRLTRTRLAGPEGAREPAGQPTRVTLPSRFTPGSLKVVDGHLWVLAVGAEQLLSLDLAADGEVGGVFPVLDQASSTTSSSVTQPVQIEGGPSGGPTQTERRSSG